MEDIKYERPDKSWGMRRVKLRLTITPGEYMALKHHAERASRASGIPVSISNAVATTMKQVHDDIRQEAENIDKEWKKNGQKYKNNQLGSTANG